MKAQPLLCIKDSLLHLTIILIIILLRGLKFQLSTRKQLYNYCKRNKSTCNCRIVNSTYLLSNCKGNCKGSVYENEMIKFAYRITQGVLQICGKIVKGKVKNAIIAVLYNRQINEAYNNSGRANFLPFVHSKDEDILMF